MFLAGLLGPMFVVLGLSILLYAKQWVKVYDGWAKGHFALLPLMFFLMLFGLFIIKLHNVWEWNYLLLVTLSGWGMFLKGALYFLAPQSVLKAALGLGKNPALMYFGGLVILVMGAALGYYAYFMEAAPAVMDIVL